MAINFAAASTAGLNNPGTEIITLVKNESGNFINPPSYDKILAYLRSGDVPCLFVTNEAGTSGDIYQLSGYSETENKIRFAGEKTAIEFSAGSDVPVVSDVVPKPLPYDYMPEGYPKKTEQTTTLLTEQEVAFANDGNIYVAMLGDDNAKVSVGQTYIVTWDGAKYECVCFDMGGSAPAIGNQSIVGGGADTGEPFLYQVPPGGHIAVQILTLDTAASHTISVKKIEERVTPIADEFLPSEVNELIMNSSTPGSTKKFKITVDDSGTISATEVT